MENAKDLKKKTLVDLYKPILLGHLIIMTGQCYRRKWVSSLDRPARCELYNIPTQPGSRYSNHVQNYFHLYSVKEKQKAWDSP